MTRLGRADIHPIARGLVDYDGGLRRRTGLSLRGMACRAAGIPEGELESIAAGISVAAVPVTGGLGVIGGFSQAVAAIVAHLGFTVFVTEGHDAAGMAEGVERGGDIFMLADDERYVALVPGMGQVVDNVWATAVGFVAGLEAMHGELAGSAALVLGCGPVGVAGAKALLERGASVALFDTQSDRALSALAGLGGKAPGTLRVEEEGALALGRYGLIFEATTQGGFIEAHHLTDSTLVAAPGMPLGLTPEALARHGDRVLHDALEIGTATMAARGAMILAGRTGNGEAGEG